MTSFVIGFVVMSALQGLIGLIGRKTEQQHEEEKRDIADAYEKRIANLKEAYENRIRVLDASLIQAKEKGGTVP